MMFLVFLELDQFTRELVESANFVCVFRTLWGLEQGGKKNRHGYPYGSRSSAYHHTTHGPRSPAP